MDIKLPEHLEKEYKEIRAEFVGIRDDWKKFEDEIIPEDPAFAKRIVKFLIDVIDYVLKNFDSIDIKKYQEFLVNFEYYFFYGPGGDNHNYMAFDERVDDELVNEFCWNLKDSRMTKAKLLKIKGKYSKVLAVL